MDKLYDYQDDCVRSDPSGQKFDLVNEVINSRMVSNASYGLPLLISSRESSEPWMTYPSRSVGEVTGNFTLNVQTEIEQAYQAACLDIGFDQDITD